MFYAIESGFGRKKGQASAQLKVRAAQRPLKVLCRSSFTPSQFAIYPSA